MKQPGSILPLALIMILTIVLAGIGIGTVVLQGSQRARDTDASVAAYYMADSGIERQLLEVRKNNQTVDYLNTLGGSYGNGGTWVSTGAYEPTTSKKFTQVSTSSFAIIDLFDPDKLNIPPGIASMHITWSKADPDCAGMAQLEVSYGYWKVVDGVPQLPDESYTVLAKDALKDLIVSPLDTGRAYRVRLKAFECAASNVTVSLFSDVNATQSKTFPGDITLGAEGTFSKTTQKITVTMPKLDVLSGLFGFAIFSECSLVKDPNTMQTCPQ